jgi:hypothetical protein
MTINRLLCEPVAVRMLERQPGMVSRICESFKGLDLMIAGSFHNARTEDQLLTWMVESDNRLKKVRLSTSGTSSKIRRHPSQTDQRHFVTGPVTRGNRSRAHRERDNRHHQGYG